MDQRELEIKRDEMNQHNHPADRRGFADRTERSHKAILDDYGALGQFKRTLWEHAEGRVLDVCCGNARFADHLLDEDLVDEFVGIDLSSVRVAEAADRLGERATMLTGDAEYLPFDDDSFDVVISSAALHHLPQWDGQGLDEIVRVLTPDGKMVFREPLKYNPFAYVFRRTSPGPCHTEHESPFDPRELRRTLERRFETVDMTGHYIVALLLPFLDGMVPVSFPPSLSIKLYDVERKIIDNGGIRLATHSHGIAYRPKSRA